MIRRRIVVSGRVQGVFFRDTCRRVAAEHGVSGSARNLPDGRVEVIVEGSPEAVEAVVAWCRHGPAGATVTDVEVNQEEPRGARGFDVG